MTRAMNPAPQRGAALVIVLLLVATLSFILLSITNIVTASVARSVGDRARADLYWRAAAGEAIARGILEKYLESAPTKMAPNEGIFGEQLELPLENGKASVVFSDATRCFNINSLVAGGAGAYESDSVNMANFVILLEAIGLGTSEATKLSEVIADFIDSDDFRQGQGAEDGFYTALPTPYRTGGRLLHSMTELRAMDGVSRALYERVRPYLCALDATAPAAVNVNFARPEHAPILLALMGAESGATAAELADQIGDLPPGGVPDISALTAPLAAVPGIVVTSGLIEARIRLEVNDRSIEEKLLFEVSGGAPPKLLARAFGDEF